MLGPGNSEAALEALQAYPGGLQVSLLYPSLLDIRAE